MRLLSNDGMVVARCVAIKTRPWLFDDVSCHCYARWNRRQGFFWHANSSTVNSQITWYPPPPRASIRCTKGPLAACSACTTEPISEVHAGKARIPIVFLRTYLEGVRFEIQEETVVSSVNWRRRRDWGSYSKGVGINGRLGFHISTYIVCFLLMYELYAFRCANRGATLTKYQSWVFGRSPLNYFWTPGIIVVQCILSMSLRFKKA